MDVIGLGTDVAIIIGPRRHPGRDDADIVGQLGLTTIAQPLDVMAGSALDRLTALLEGEHASSVQHDVELILRRTHGPATTGMTDPRTWHFCQAC